MEKVRNIPGNGLNYILIEDADAHQQLLKYPELFEALQQFDVSLEKEMSETFYEFGKVPYSSALDIALASLAKFLHSRLSTEEVAILSFMRYIIDEEYRFAGYEFMYSLLDGTKRFIQKFVEEEDIQNACVYFIESIHESIVG